MKGAGKKIERSMKREEKRKRKEAPMKETTETGAGMGIRGMEITTTVWMFLTQDKEMADLMAKRMKVVM